MHHLDHGLHLLDRCVLQDAMSQVEDVTGAACGAAQDVFDASFEFGERGEEGGRVEIALHSTIVTDNLPALVERDAPVESDDRAASLFHQRQEGGGVGPEMDDRHARRFGGFQHPL